MPALIGGFGKIKTKAFSTLESSNDKNYLNLLRPLPFGSSQKLKFSTQALSLRSWAEPGARFAQKNMKGMNPYYVTGFTDAEGCFNLDISNSRSKNWSVAARFTIKLHIADIDILYKVQSFFGGAGSVTVSGNTANYRISKLKDIIGVVIPHFEQYPLQSAKSIDFQIWKASVFLIKNKEHLTEEGLLKIISLRSGLNKGLSDSLKTAFPKFSALDMSVYTINNLPILNPYWVSGFIDGDGSFTATIEPTTNYVNLRLIIGLNQRESFLIDLILKFFDNKGRINYSSDKKVVYYTISNIKDLSEKIIPHFSKYSLIGYKNIHYLMWKDILIKVKSRVHLTQEGINQIKDLRSKLNKYSAADSNNQQAKVDYDDILSDTPGLIALERKDKNPKGNLKVTKPSPLGPKGLRSFSTKTYCSSKDTFTHRFSSYLAGLIEADGSFAIHDINSKAKKYAPKIVLVFSLNDSPLAEKLISIIPVGKLYRKENQGCIIWSIQNSGDVIKIINIINGFFRSAKILELHKAINWLNINHNAKIDIMPLDSSSLGSNSWLAGFALKRSTFSTKTTADNKLRVILNFKLKINIVLANFDTESLLKWLLLFCQISEYLNTSFITEIKDLAPLASEAHDKKKYTFIIYAYTLKSKKKVIEYFSKYPLLGNVCLDYELLSETFKITGGNSLVSPQTKAQVNFKVKSLRNIPRGAQATEVLKNLSYYLPNSNQSKLDLSGKRKYSTQRLVENKNSASHASHAFSTSTSNETGHNLAWLFTGFSDGEACFYISILKNEKYNGGFSVRLSFEIKLHKKERAVLELFRSVWGIGIISDRPKYISYIVTGSEDLEVVINHFDNYPLITKKWVDYQLFKRAFFILKSKEHLTLKGIKKIAMIKASMNRGNLPSELKLAFPDIKPVELPSIKYQEIKNPFWFSGFTYPKAAEGSFFCSCFEASSSKLGKKVSLRFSLAQHFRDESLIRSLILYLGCGQVYIRANGDAVDFKITRFDSIVDKLIPFFLSNPLIGTKALDFKAFCEIAELIKNKAHLTIEGLESIQKIRDGMNLKRK